MSGWLVLGVALAYLASLFAVASYGDRIASRRAVNAPRPYIYALSLAVYCTSWTFFGSVGLAAERGLEFLGIYLGPLIMFTFGLPLIRLIVLRAKAENITSVADFLAARYGKSSGVAALAAFIAVVGAVPYVALQLKAISDSVTLVVSNYSGTEMVTLPFGVDISLIIALLLSLFAILFGTRHADATEHQDGLILAIALESVIKLAAFLIVGAVVTFAIFDGPFALARAASGEPRIAEALAAGSSGGNWIVLTLLSAFAVLALPREFGVTVVENRSVSELKAAGWLFPLYLVAINIFVFPIAAAGILTFGNTVPGDSFVLALPMAQGYDLVAFITFIGGLSAATAMVIVASVALAIMISNDIVIPLLLRQGGGQPASGGDWSALILNIRRIAIFVVLVAAFLYYRQAANNTRLASIGLLSFAAVAQFAPSLLIGLTWRKANARGAKLGLSAGFAVWGYTLLAPALAGPGSDFTEHGLFDLGFLKPQSLFGFSFEPLAHGVFWSLLANTVLLIAGSLSRPATALERIQAAAFIPRETPQIAALRRFRTSITVDEVKDCIARYVGVERTERSFEAFAAREGRRLAGSAPADMPTLRFAEQLLASAIGSSSSRLVLSLLMQKEETSRSEAMRLLDDASEALQQNRDLLQTALDQMEQGITVLDRDFRLTCWNRQFRRLLDLPPEIGQFGTPLTEILERLKSGGQIVDASLAEAVRRLAAFGEPWRLELSRSGRTLEIRSNPMPDGGLVTTYTDITKQVLADQALKRANESLEQRVAERTGELTRVNKELAGARQRADDANISKTRFLAAAGHDILQPLNAARLYSSSLVDRLGESENRDIVRNIDTSLESVEAILGAVLDISRLDTGAMKPAPTVFSLGELLAQIGNDFQPVAGNKGLKLRIVSTSLNVRTDRNLMRRLIQNLVSNAIKYTPAGRVLVGVRRRGSGLSVEVYDTGIGIAPGKTRVVFQEFTRLDEGAREASGLGLGVSIVGRISGVLGFPSQLESRPGLGSRFSVRVPVSAEPLTQVDVVRTTNRPGPTRFDGLKVACLDNDPQILSGMKLLLEGWGCDVQLAESRAELFAGFTGHGLPAILLADYHLSGDLGLDVIEDARATFNPGLAAVLVTADRSAEVKARAAGMDVAILHKPLRPAALRAIVAQHRALRIAAE